MIIGATNLDGLQRLPKKYLDLSYESSIQKHTFNTIPFLVVGTGPYHKLALKQLNLAIQHEVGPFGMPIEGLMSMPEDRGLGKAIIRKEVWDSSLLDNIDVYSIMVLDRQNNQMKLFIPDINIQDIKRYNTKPISEGYQFTLAFNPNDIFVDAELTIRKTDKQHLRRAETVLKDL